MTRSPLAAAAIACALAFSIVFSSTAHAAEVGFIEDFALAKDRSEALKQLIPGTHDYYYFHCLHYLNTEQWDQAQEALAAWQKRYPNQYPAPMIEIMNRQALLTYDQDPQKTLNYLRSRLNLHFNHQRETEARRPNLPSKLDPNLIGRQRLTQVAYGRHSDRSTNGFEDRALDWLVATDLTPDARRHLLQRLDRPDYPNLPQLVVEDLRYRNSSGFGSMNIHRLLLLDQLETCLKLYPELLNHTHFVNTYLTKLHPNPDIDWRHNPNAYDAYLGRLWTFVQRLNESHNSLKAHVLYHRLVFNRSRGVWDKDLFMAYIKLPRYAPYVNNDWMRREDARRHACNLNANYEPFTLLPVVGNDEPLIESYFHHFFVNETRWQPYETWISDIYLKHHFAEVKLVNGLGDAEQWYSMLPPAKVQEIQNRIDLDFAYTNSEQFAINDPVSVDVYVKNVKTLIVKVYEVNAFNYYRDNLSEVDTDINLDGLVANEETTLAYDDPPMRRIARHFEFPKLNRRGVYVIDFIGNGKSSRVLVRKGKLRYVVRTSTAGHVFNVLDEANKPVKDASLWLAEVEHKADEDGAVTVPFTNRPGQEPIILLHDGFASFDYFNQESENYELRAGIHADREALVQRRKANVLIRPALYLNGTPVTLGVLEQVRLVITSTDLDGVQSSKEVSDFKLFEDREAVYEFTVPQRLRTVRFDLFAKVQNLSQNQKIDLHAQESFSLNQIAATEKTEDVHLLSADGDYIIELLGRTGEVLPDKTVNVELKHRDFKESVHVTLLTDARGRVSLGALPGIDWVRARGPQGVNATFPLRRDQHTYHSVVHGKAGRPLAIPFMGDADRAQRGDISLLEVRGSTFVADRFNAAKVSNGFLRVDDLPRGDYDLLLKDLNQRITIKLTEGVDQNGWVLGEHRHLEQRNVKPLQIVSVDAGAEDVKVTLANASPFSRVHVFATRYDQPWAAYDGVSRVTDPEPYYMITGTVQTAYAAGRNIGDEYRYILERKYMKKYPGNMLDRPGLLLNPWAIRETQTGEQIAQGGDAFGGKGRSSNSQGGRDGSRAQGMTVKDDFSNLDFLGATSAVMLNLSPDEAGVVTIARKDLGGRQHIHIVAVDPQNTVSRAVTLPEPELQFVDLRLRDGLDPQQHFSEQKQISIVRPGDKFTIADITASDFEAYDTLARVYTLFATLSNDANLIEFSFILDWHKLDQKQKQEKYSKYACHELNFFIARKDPNFFNGVVKPYLAHKRDKTFMDHYLLGTVTNDFVQPWEYGRLNTVERMLLAQAIQGEMRYTSRHVTDQFHLIPPDIDRFNHLFKTALQGSALDTGDAFGFNEARDKAMPSERFRSGLKMQDRADATADPAAESAGAGPARGRAPAPKPAAAAPPGQPPPAKDDAYADRPADARANRDESAKKLAESKRESAEKDADYDYAEANMRRLAGKAKQDFYADDAKRRAEVRQYYRKLEATKEWVENNYYKLPIEQQLAGLITVNAMWNDYSNHDHATPFQSTNLAEASRNFAEMMFALSVLDLPFEAKEHKTEFNDKAMTLDPGGPMVIYHQEIKPAEVVKDAPILVSQNFFRHGDRYRIVNGERIDKYVTDEFLVHTVYGCQIVITNPASSTQKLDVLLQVPQGAIAVLNGKETRGVHMQLGAFSTQAIEYYFYFPAAGDYPHYPVHVAKNEQTVAFAEPVTLKVVHELTQVDKTSWAWISQNGTEGQVIEYMEANNLHAIDLEKIAWRMKDKAFFEKVAALTGKRHAYHHTLFSYGLLHNDAAAIREYLEHSDAFVRQCGLFLDSTLLAIDPVERHDFQFREYSPLVNARAHQLGKRREIVNDRMSWQYHELLRVLSYKRAVSDDDGLAVSYYMLLQDRVDEAFAFFGQVNPQKVATRVQYDEMAAYIDFYTPDMKVARGIVETYKDYPVDRWRNTFAAIGKQLDEIQGGVTEVTDDEDRAQQQTKLAATEPNVEFTVEAKRINLIYQNLKEVTVNYYLMDVELLFSRSPFASDYGSTFSYIKPNESQAVKLNEKATQLSVPLPDQYHTKNVLVEVVGAGKRQSQAYYANAMTVQVIENYGQVRVTAAAGGRAIPKAYVKVYAQLGNGQVKFYKDGYTDLRGRFDYSSLNTSELDSVRKFAVLVLSEEFGAVVREAEPPKQ